MRLVWDVGHARSQLIAVARRVLVRRRAQRYTARGGCQLGVSVVVLGSVQSSTLTAERTPGRLRRCSNACAKRSHVGTISAAERGVYARRSLQTSDATSRRRIKSTSELPAAAPAAVDHSVRMSWA